MLEDATTHADVEAVEEATAQAQFQEVCSKIAQLIWKLVYPLRIWRRLSSSVIWGH